MKPIRSWVLLSMVMSLGTSLPVQACSYDGQFNNPFTESFPGSLDIAIATQNALEENHVKQVDALDGKQGLRRVSWWLKLMAKQHSSALESVSYIYLVDSHLWSKVTQGNQLDIHSSPTSQAKLSVMLLSEAALNALIEDDLDLQGAIDLGIVQFSS
ncbi:hypothetical protein [Vibrio genomosp. F10]|uniref:Uncharacterized protein n=1 Tax=Vibrio genomosp. F10 TaxID=723171 RepID=A0A1B9R1V4_9VIBR|nr:hypothetical protein [Vibrio genomosp. F10]OCH78253.1 hypothetical protein A6E14_05425 [Vibrio genomosp. F10]OEE92745.1 hypothetical protein A1QM_11645 [Vibrio genomosp. F10 str. 9ZC157]OEF01236.1 hypothetical protein A1QK_11275 [Vibrio genomosp. F10 str. 9ZD137]OEF05390.1 hypothetical protein A1QI_08495 [Vibrio genomosp. F10 str. 9ZB36]